MDFPCDFPIKIVGINNATFATSVVEIARKYFPDLEEADVKQQPSKQANYLAITITVRAHDQITLDALYMELTSHPDIKMVL